MRAGSARRREGVRSLRDGRQRHLYRVLGRRCERHYLDGQRVWRVWNSKLKLSLLACREKRTACRSESIRGELEVSKAAPQTVLNPNSLIH